MEQEEEEDDEQECCFHDSLDRLLSSSNTSCSCSPTTTSEEDSDSVSNDYDVWISQPSSVEERRVRLLRQMGLSVPSGKPNTTVNNNNYKNGLAKANYTVIGRLKDVNNNDDNNTVSGLGIERSSSVNESTPAVSPNKPPKGKVTTLDESFNSLLEINDNVIVNPNVSAEVCMIKNLDNGKEFVVNEVRDDGMWQKIKEVGTGRQLTMEEFSSEMCVGTSPIVQELMRRQNVEDGNKESFDPNANSRSSGSGPKLKKRGSWLKSFKNLSSSVTAGYKERRSSDEKDSSSEKGGRRSSSATDDSNHEVGTFHGPERVKVRQYGKSVKDLTALFKSQEIQAHNGSIWAIKFSLNGKYLASAGEDCLIHVWQVIETERKGDFFFEKSEEGNFNLLFVANGSPEPSSLSPKLDRQFEKKRRGGSSISRKSVSLEQILVPETVFALSEKPICSFQGHLDDVLDLSWSKSQKLLSSSMDKTVRLWDLSSKTCLKIFSHSDYVTCIQFNPVDERYFISGSLDAKVRIWSIPDRQVVDWSDLHEMVTAACYTPDGQGALVGSYKGSCRLFNTSDNKLQQKSHINLQNKKKKSHHRKITGFQFAPKSSSEVLITSSDSRIRVVDGISLVHKFKGFRNMNSQISGSVTSNGKYVISASEDSYVYVWKNEGGTGPNRSKGVTVTQSYELFHCQDVSIAIPWPGMSSVPYLEDEISVPIPTTTPVEGSNSNSPLNGTLSTAAKNYLFDRFSLSWPEERLLSPNTRRNPRTSPRVSTDFSNQNNNMNNISSGWGMVIVSAGLKGEIRTFQNFGLPVRI